jgi:hypothetical protein
VGNNYRIESTLPRFQGSFEITMNFIAYSKELKGIKPAQEVFVAFLDILGFSGFVRNNTHDNLTAIYQSFFRPIIDMSLTEADLRPGSW